MITVEACYDPVVMPTSIFYIFLAATCCGAAHGHAGTWRCTRSEAQIRRAWPEWSGAGNAEWLQRCWRSGRLGRACVARQCEPSGVVRLFFRNQGITTSSASGGDISTHHRRLKSNGMQTGGDGSVCSSELSLFHKRRSPQVISRSGCDSYLVVEDKERDRSMDR